MRIDARYKGMMFMLLAALGFSLMGGAAKMLKDAFNAGQLVFFRNAVGLIFLLPGFIHKPWQNKGGKFPGLVFRGIMGTTALYTLLFCILHMPLGTAMTYNISSTIWIAVLSFLIFGEYNGTRVLFAILLGFAGMLLIYKPIMHLPIAYHFAGILSGLTSAIAYLTVGRLAGYYDPRVIVLSFLVSGFMFPLISMGLHHVIGVPEDGLFIISWKMPDLRQTFFILGMGLAALFGQYFVTRAYGSDRAGIVSAFSYASIVFSLSIGLMLGDALPDLVSVTGIFCIVSSGIIISLFKRKVSEV
jgi:drug/metabolite transporter (DMT)-like permease